MHSVPVHASIAAGRAHLPFDSISCRRAAYTLAGLLLTFAAASSAWSVTVLDRGLVPGDAEIGIATQSQQDHAVARGGDRFLAVWSDYRAQAVGGASSQSGAEIFGVRLDAGGNALDAAPIRIAGGMGGQRTPLVAWNGENWLVLYISQDPVGGYFAERIRGVRVSPAGQVLDSTPISFPETQYEPATMGLQLAGQAGQWMVTRCIYHNDGYGTYLAGQRISGAGVLLDTTPVQLIDWVYGSTRLIASDGEYLAAGPDWNNSATTKARRIGTDGQPFGASFTLPGLTLAGNGSEYYVTWIKDYVNLVGSRVTLDGSLLTPNGTMIVSNYSQYNQSTLSHDGTNWWFEWGASDQLHTVRISGSGTVLDPGGGFLLPIVIDGNIDNAYNPVLVGRPSGGVLLLWYDLRIALGYDSNVFVLPIEATNVPGTERALSTSTRNQRVPDLSAGPDGNAAVVFVSEHANADHVLVSFLGPDGTFLNTEPIEVASAPTIGEAAMAWNGSLFLVTWDEGTGGSTPTQIKARRLDATGAWVDSTPFDVMPGFGPDVEALGGDFLIACARVHTYPQFIYTWMRIVDGASGTFQNAATLIGGGYVNVGPRVRQDGSRWIVTYHSHWSHDNPASDALYNFVSPDGSYTPASNPCSTSGGSGTPDVAFSGGKYLFVWRNNSLANANNFIAGRIMNADGTFAANNFTIAEAPGRQLQPVVDWDGTSFVVAWDDQRNQDAFFDARTDIYAARVSEAGAVLDPSGFAIQSGPEGDATVALLSRADGVSFVGSARFVLEPPVDSYRVGISVIGDMFAADAPDLATTGDARFFACAPNPFRGQTTIRFALERPVAASLSIHDVSGREVWRSVDVPAGAGMNQMSWDGRDANGRELPVGTYFVRLASDGRSRTEPVTIVR